jgi:hypothetical protein
MTQCCVLVGFLLLLFVIGQNAGAVVSVKAWTGVFTSTLALVALWL